MQRHTFEAPVRSRWPLFVAGVLVAFCAAGWFWMSRGGTGAQAVGEGELMGASSEGSGSSSTDQNRSPAVAARPEASAQGAAGAGDANMQGSASASEGDGASEGEEGADDRATDRTSGGMTLPERAGGAEEDETTIASLLAQADEAYDAGNLVVAYPLYKEAAVRIQVQINTTEHDARRAELEAELISVRELARECEAGLRASAPAIDMANRTPHPSPKAGVIPELAIKELGNFPYDDEKGGVPDDVAKLDGTQIRLTGYMLPAFQTDQIKTFTLVADVYQCCFGQPPGVEHMINVVLPDGKAVPFTYGEIQVTGTLRIVEERRDGYVINVFTLSDVTSVRATGKQ